jgi:ADP-heptose:LPS heptosyltransferase
MNRILIVIAMRVYQLRRGWATRVPERPQRILLVQMAKLGDMVCTTPVLHALRKAYPQAHVVVMGNKTNKAVLEGNQDFDEYFVFSGIRNTAKVLRTKKFDIALLAGGPDLGSLAAAFFANVPCIVTSRIEGGWSPLNDVWYRLAARCAVAVPHVMHQYAPREYLKLLESINIFTEDIQKHLAYSAAGGEHAQDFFERYRLSGLVIGMAPAAGNKIKEWPAERFALLADYLVEKYGATVIVIGNGKDEKEVTDMMVHFKTNDRIINTLNQFSIDELKAIVAKLSLFISADTGPIYIAEAFDVPTVDITGPIDEREQPPIGDRHLVVTPPPPRIPQLFVLNAKHYDYAEARRQAESITVEAVMKVCDSLLAKLYG